MHEFLAVVATFVFGLSVTAIVAVGLEYRQLANRHVDENADVRPGIIKVTEHGYAVAPAPGARRARLPGGQAAHGYVNDFHSSPARWGGVREADGGVMGITLPPLTPPALQATSPSCDGEETT